MEKVAKLWSYESIMPVFANLYIQEYTTCAASLVNIGRNKT